MKKILSFVIILLAISIFFRSFLMQGKLPIPSDSLVGLYHPFRDFFATDYPRGMPFKNFLITDPVRQQYVWRYVAYQFQTKGIMPIWNPYNGLGMPLLANQQSAVLYPLNILFFILPFATAWSLQVFFTPILGSIFLYLYVRQIRLSVIASIFASISFAFCGFSIAWLEWNTVVQSFLWFPFILWNIEKLFGSETGVKRLEYALFASFGLVFSLFAGHLQTFFYVGVVSTSYFLLKLLIDKKNYLFAYFFLFAIVVGIISLVQLIPTFQLISLSARNIDLDSTKAGWFVPAQHLLQFFVPDFFGNPTTLNYWGVWNYAELVGYIGIIPLIFSAIGGLFVRRKNIYFFLGVLLLSLLFAIDNPIARLPFILHIPFLSTSQPTRLMSLIDFSLIILAAYGIDHIKKLSKKQLFFVLGIFLLVFASLWIFILFGHKIISTFPPEYLMTAKRNSVLSTGLFVVASTFILLLFFIKKQKAFLVIMSLLLLLTTYDGIRFADKFTPFTSQSLLYPTTKTISFLQQNLKGYRYMTTDDKILPPNSSAYYQLKTLDVYDPLYLLRYGEFIAAMQRGKPDIASPFGFNRIITPHAITNPFISLLGVKYVVSLDQISNPQFKKVLQEGQTTLYENTAVLPRVFFVKSVILAVSKEDAIEKLYVIKDTLSEKAVVEGTKQVNQLGLGKAILKKDTPNEVVIETSTENDGFLVLSDIYYPTWHVFVDGKESRIYVTDYLLRGVFVPKGKHTIAFKVSLF